MKTQLRNRPMLLLFLALYFGYMGAIAQIDRVMYLYHYFLPLLFSFCVLAVVIMEIRRVGRWDITNKRRLGALLALTLLIFASYEFYRPLSNYEPISDGAFRKRELTELWELHCVNCAKTSPFVEKP